MKRTCLLFFLLPVHMAYGQGDFLSRFTLRQSFQSTDESAEPAMMSMTKPQNLGASWLLHAAVGYDLAPFKKAVLTLEPYVEYHKNTLIEKVQDNWQAGLTSQWQTNDISKRSWSPILISSAKFNQDRADGVSSMMANVYATAILKGKRRDAKYFWVPNHTADFGEHIEFFYAPYIGLESENRLHVDQDAAAGSIYRALFRISSSVSVWTRKAEAKGTFLINLDWHHRTNFYETVEALDQLHHAFLTTGLSYRFFLSPDREQFASIGLDYTTGENPCKNFRKQQYYALALKVKL